MHNWADVRENRFLKLSNWIHRAVFGTEEFARNWLRLNGCRFSALLWTLRAKKMPTAKVAGNLNLLFFLFGK